MSSKGRWPRWVYSEGVEPDYRLSFANEGTFLARIRTSLTTTEAEVNWSRAVVALARRHEGLLVHDGLMIDGPLIARAQSILKKNGEIDGL